MHSLSHMTLASLLIAVGLATSSCGGGGGEASSGTAPAPSSTPAPGPVVNYPTSFAYTSTMSSMYNLDNAQECATFDPYCRSVANKEGFLALALDSSVTSVVLQMSSQPTNVLQSTTVASDCDAACWRAAAASGPSTLHLNGERTVSEEKNTFRFRIPSHLNNKDTLWLASIQSLRLENNATVQQTYSPKSVERQYFDADPINIVLVPMRIRATLPANLPNIFQIAQHVSSHIPLAIGSVRVSDPVDITNGTSLESIDDFSAALRQLSQQVNATAGNTYWYGLFNSALRNSAFTGLGYQPGYAAIGWDDKQWNQTMTHEMGHNFSLDHAPCGTGIGYLDKGYPYANGHLFAVGSAHYPFDLVLGQTRTDQTKDVMGYCAGEFFSDYSIATIWKYVKSKTPSTSANKAARNSVAPWPFTLAELHMHWDRQPPVPTQIFHLPGQVYVWKEGLSDAPVLRMLTVTPEKALPGLALELQHPDGAWYSGVAYRTSDKGRLEFWTPGPGTPVAIRAEMQ